MISRNMRENIEMETKISLFGYHGVGKTSWIRQVSWDSTFRGYYDKSFVSHVSYGTVITHDRQEKSITMTENPMPCIKKDLLDQMLKNKDMVLIFYDKREESWVYAEEIYLSIRKLYPDMKIVFVWNKIDLIGVCKHQNPEEILQADPNTDMFVMSLKTGYNIYRIIELLFGKGSRIKTCKRRSNYS